MVGCNLDCVGASLSKLLMSGHILEGFFGANAPVGPSSCPSNNVENSIFAPENGPL